MKRLTILLLCCTFGMYINAQEKTLEPRVLLPVPDIDLVQCEKLVIAANDDYWKSPVCVTPEAQVPLTLESKFRMTPIKS